jgi:hypothetical protein
VCVHFVNTCITVIDKVLPYIETIEHTKTTVLAQETVIQQQNQTINNLTNKINKLGSRIEKQEQLTSPMGCDLPMSLVLSCSPSLVLHIFRTRASVSFWIHDCQNKG